MILTANDIAGDSTLQADLLIVGGGAAGISIARRFAGSRHKVLLLESGGEEYSDAAQALYQGKVVGQRIEDPDVSRLRFFGGTTNHWAGWCRALDAEDFAPRADWPESGWPLRREELASYYAQAAEVCQIGRAVLDDAAFYRDEVGKTAGGALPRDGGNWRTTVFQLSPPTHFAAAYGAELKASDNVTVLLDGTALELLSDAGRAGGVAVVSASGQRFEVRAPVTVLAVGGIETARFMLLSKALHPNGAGNEHDLVGRYFMDHPWLSGAAYLRFSEPGTMLPLYYEEAEAGGTRFLSMLSPDPAWARQQGIGGLRAWLQPTRTSNEGNASLQAIGRSLSRFDWPDHLGEHIGNVVRDWDVVADSAYKTIFNEKSSPFLSEKSEDEPYRGLSIDVNIEQRPNRDSRVMLGEERDRNDQPRVVLDWRLGESEWLTAKRGLGALAEEFGRLGLGRMRLGRWLEDEGHWPRQLDGSRHHMGTARMASDPRQGVVDADCRVHGVPGLYVAGSAVFPTGGFANPTLTIVALALRLSEHLKKVLN